MAEKKNLKKQALEDNDLDLVSGGAFTSEYSDAEYWDAGKLGWCIQLQVRTSNQWGRIRLG
ncbi:MAG: hypothetical protein IKD66_15680 [Solobacterium sp.]|nr:hypothetical protein [Solobacterium sp.]